MKILNFKNLVENPQNIKSGELMSVDSAVWHIEALLNYEYCVIEDSTEIYVEKSNDSIISNVILEKDRISIEEIVNQYFVIETELQKQLDKIKETNKRVEIVDVTFESGIFTTYTLFNFGEQVSGGKYSHKITDDWQWGNKYGNCSGTILHRDASDEYTDWFATHIPLEALIYCTWTDVQVYGDGAGTQYFSTVQDHYSLYNNPSYVSLYPYMENPNYLYFHVDTGYVYNHHYCIEVDQSKIYCQNLVELKPIIEQNFLPTNYKIKILEVEDIEQPVQDNNSILHISTYHIHRLKVTYGKPVSTITYIN